MAPSRQQTRRCSAQSRMGSSIVKVAVKAWRWPLYCAAQAVRAEVGVPFCARAPTQLASDGPDGRRVRTAMLP
eukprot:479823-Prymnesium_polylepis.1